MENIVPTIEQAPQNPQEGFVPVTSPVESQEIPVEVAETTPVSTGKGKLITTPTESTVDSTDTSTPSISTNPWGGSGYIPAVDNDGNETKGDFMSSLILQKGNGTPVTE